MSPASCELSSCLVIFIGEDQQANALRLELKNQFKLGLNQYVFVS